MNPKNAVPPGQARPEEAPSTLERLLAVRGLMYALIGVLTLGVVVFITILILDYSSAKASDRAWAAYNDVMTELVRAADSGYQQFLPEHLLLQMVDPKMQVAAFEGLLENVNGSSAEPHALYRLGSALLLDRDLDRAEATFRQLQERFPSHYLVNQERYYHTKSLVTKALEDCTRQREFLDANPDFLSGRAPDDLPGDPEQDSSAAPRPDGGQPNDQPPADTDQGKG